LLSFLAGVVSFFAFFLFFLSSSVPHDTAPTAQFQRTVVTVAAR
jgi:uncharacterized protein (DUF58 family)